MSLIQNIQNIDLTGAATTYSVDSRAIYIQNKMTASAEGETQALQNGDVEGETKITIQPMSEKKGKRPEPTSKFVIKIVLICAMLLAIGGGVIVALLLTDPLKLGGPSLPGPLQCQNDTSKRLFSIASDSTNTQYYLSDKIAPWPTAEYLCQQEFHHQSGLLTTENSDSKNYVTSQIGQIDSQVSDYWTSGHFSNATSEWLWKNGKNTTVAGHEQAEGADEIGMCLNVSASPDEEGGSVAKWVKKPCNFPSHFVCQTKCIPAADTSS